MPTLDVVQEIRYTGHVSWPKLADIVREELDRQLQAKFPTDTPSYDYYRVDVERNTVKLLVRETRFSTDPLVAEIEVTLEWVEEYKAVRKVLGMLALAQ